MQVFEVGLNVPKVNRKIRMRLQLQTQVEGSKMKSTKSEIYRRVEGSFDGTLALLSLREPSFLGRCAVDGYYSPKRNRVVFANPLRRASTLDMVRREFSLPSPR